MNLSRPRILTACALFALTWAVVFVDHGLRSLWPSVVALGLVFLTRSVLGGLLAGAVAGTVLLKNGNPFTAFVGFFSEHLIPALQSSWNISVLVFTLLMGGFVALIEHGGGMRALLNRFLGEGPVSRRRVEGATFGFGLLCFFDGLANAMLVGRVMRPMADRAGVSREKLAYIVDSTSSPIACVAFISTWIAYQLSMIQEGLGQAGMEGNAYLLFLQSIPRNFYCWFTLLLVVLVILRGWDFGVMARARVYPADEVISRGPKSGAWQALLPLGLLVAGLPVGLYLSGAAKLGLSGLPSFSELATAFGKSDTALVLVVVSALAALVAWACNARAGEAGKAFVGGMTTMFFPLLILVSAWCLSSTLKQLGAADALGALLSGNLPPGLLPLCVFLVGAAISFSTGTSWGTMGVLMPLAVPLAVTLGADIPGNEILIMSIAAVFSGAVFGDHCSPVSDTTLVSSLACGVPAVDHVRAQLPYALLAGGLAVGCGFLPVALGLPAAAGLALGAGILVALSAWSARSRR